MAKKGRKRKPSNTAWRMTERKINGEMRKVKVRRHNGKEQVRIISEPKTNPLNEPLPSDAAPGDQFTRVHLVKGRRQQTTYERTEKEGFGKWRIIYSKFL